MDESGEAADTPAPIVQVVADLNDGTPGRLASPSMPGRGL